MRLQGRITHWDDERGFGFISWHGDGSKIFFHIRAFSARSRRPEIGDIVSFEKAKGKDGKPRAEKIRYSGQAIPKRRPPARNHWFPVVFTALFAGLMIVSAIFDRIAWLVVVAYVAASLVSFLAYGWDKSSARLGNWRTQESSLHLLDLIGGWPGGLAAQRLLRHKSSKREFLSTFWLTVFLNAAFALHLVWSGDAGFINQLIDATWRSATGGL